MIRKLFKWTFRLAALLITVSVLLALGRNVIARLLLEHRLEAATGFEAAIGRVQIDLTRPVVRITHLRLFNPPQLGRRPFVDILEARITYDLNGLLARRFLVRELRVGVGDVRFVRKDPGVSTQDLFARHRRGREPIGNTLVHPLAYTGVDQLLLSAERYSYIDYVQMARTQDLPLALRDLQASNLTKPEDWTQLWLRFAEHRGIVPPPLFTPGEITPPVISNVTPAQPRVTSPPEPDPE
jgi:hypothetical protein